MTTYVAVPLHEDYLSLSDQVASNLKEKVSKPQAKDTVKSTKILIDSIFEILVDDLIKEVKMKPFAQKVLRQIGGFAHKSINSLIDKVISKLNNKELFPVVEYFKATEVEFENEKYLGFELDKRLETLLFSAIKNTEKGNAELAKKELVQVLEEVTLESLEVFLVKPMALIKLGLISRKVVNFVSAALEKAAPPAIGKIVEHMDQEELESLKDFLHEFIFSDHGFDQLKD
jgi:hypothetical protein